MRERWMPPAIRVGGAQVAHIVTLAVVRTEIESTRGPVSPAGAISKWLFRSCGNDLEPAMAS